MLSELTLSPACAPQSPHTCTSFNKMLCVPPSLVDEAGKMVSEDGTEVTVEGAVEDQEVEKDEDGQEVIKVYIFKADSGEDDMG